jgi:trehalose-6-phosphate synthase/NhaP-type Na+/H+ or K+/H+ antiporter
VRHALALALAFVSVLWARGLTQPAGSAPAGTALAIGFTLLGAWVAGDLIRRFRLPRLTGYILFGALIGPGVGDVITAPMAAQLQFITGIATTLIALIAGLSLNFERLGQQFRAIARLTVVTVSVAMVILGVAAWAAWPWLAIAPSATGLDRLAIVALLVVITVSFSPTMTAAVITETGARGRFSETVLAVVVLADLALIVLFSLGMLFARATFGMAPADGVGLLARFAWEIGGAVSFGVLVGAVFALYMRFVGREVAIAVIVVCALLSQAGRTQAFEPLLAAVTAGLVIENLAIAQGDTLKAAVQSAALPVLLIFFVAVGTSLHLEVLREAGLVVLGLIGLRLIGIRLGVALGLRHSSLAPGVGNHLWTGLISQSGITLGIASVVATEFTDWGPRIQALLVAAIAVHELVGPLLFRRGLTLSQSPEVRAERPLVVVSNREPYLHRQDDSGRIVASAATGGVAVALDALMRERSGVWVAHGAGPADRQVVDAFDKVRVPPESPSYVLRRLWLEEPTFSAYYNGFANEGLWPLCHQVDVRPRFRGEDWAAYCDINRRFAVAVTEEVATPQTPIFIQDYHLALVAPALRARLPQARTALFWHIPWPSPDRFRICPWARDLLAGLLANDLLAFQLDRDRRNFLLAAEDILDVEFEPESSRVRFEDRYTTVVSVPIGVDYDRIQSMLAQPALPGEQDRLSSLFGLSASIIGMGVDRLDYTKGIPERLEALDRLLTERPGLRGSLTFVQIGVPSRSTIDSYAAIERDIGERIAALNTRHAVSGGAPAVRYHTQPLGLSSLVALYRLADFCVVSSLHDGMNLVAKEFVASRDDEGGVLVLSRLAGAAQELQDAVIINPYDIDGFAEAIGRAIDMSPEERRARMRAMRRVVAGRDVFGWASDILEGLESLWTKPLHYSVHRWEDMSV